MADLSRTGSGVPRVILRRADDFVGRLEALKADAVAQGFGTLAYFIDAALIEARLQLDRVQEDREIERKAPDELWLPVRDRD